MCRSHALRRSANRWIDGASRAEHHQHPHLSHRPLVTRACQALAAAASRDPSSSSSASPTPSDESSTAARFAVDSARGTVTLRGSAPRTSQTDDVGLLAFCCRTPRRCAWARRSSNFGLRFARRQPHVPRDRDHRESTRERHTVITRTVCPGSTEEAGCPQIRRAAVFVLGVIPAFVSSGQRCACFASRWL